MPQDYRDVLREAVPAALARSGVDPARVRGIATDVTACTVLPAACAVWEPHPVLGTTAEELHDLAETALTELLVIDADTTSRRSAQELRWNAAAHAGGTR